MGESCLANCPNQEMRKSRKWNKNGNAEKKRIRCKSSRKMKRKELDS